MLIYKYFLILLAMLEDYFNNGFSQNFVKNLNEPFEWLI